MREDEPASVPSGSVFSGGGGGGGGLGFSLNAVDRTSTAGCIPSVGHFFRAASLESTFEGAGFVVQTSDGTFSWESRLERPGGPLEF